MSSNWKSRKLWVTFAAFGIAIAGVIYGFIFRDAAVIITAIGAAFGGNISYNIANNVGAKNNGGAKGVIISEP